jgi:hypothetical protein
MNCSTCRYELSQCLDGRLPSGRRTLVMQHVAECQACAGFWSELQAAQQLILQLPTQRVGDTFREQLWERVRAGEGTPDAVFREPIPLASKLRYATTGAAAAAIVLATAMWWHRTRGSAANDIVTFAPSGDAVALAPRDATHDPLPPVDTSPLLNAARPLTADLVAVEAAKQLQQHYQLTSAAIRELDASDPSAPQHAFAVQRVFDNAVDLRHLCELLIELRDRDRLSFRDSQVDVDLRVAAANLDDQRLQVRTLDTVRNVVAPTVLSTSRLGGIVRTILVTPTMNPGEEADVVFRLATQRPEVIEKLFIVFRPGDPGAPPGELRIGSGLSWLFDECGPGLVAPLSEIDAANGRLWLQRAGTSQRPVRVRLEVEGRSANPPKGK